MLQIKFSSLSKSGLAFCPRRFVSFFAELTTRKMRARLWCADGSKRSLSPSQRAMEKPFTPFRRRKIITILNQAIRSMKVLIYLLHLFLTKIRKYWRIQPNKKRCVTKAISTLLTYYQQVTDALRAVTDTLVDSSREHSTNSHSTPWPTQRLSRKL